MNTDPREWEEGVRKVWSRTNTADDYVELFCQLLAAEREALKGRMMNEVRIGNLDLSRPDSWEKGYNECLIRVLALLTTNDELYGDKRA